MNFKYRGGSFLLGPTAFSDIVTPEGFDSEQKMMANMTREFIEAEVEPHIEAIEHHDFGRTVQLLKQAGELGLLGVEVPEEYGGLGLDKVTATLITEELAPGGPWALSHGAHVGIGTLPIVYFGTPEQKEKYLPGLASGALLSAYALTEPNSGSDALGAKATAVLSEDGQHYVLNGTKQWITNAGFADVFIVYAKVDGDKFSTFIVEAGYEGVSTGPEEKKMGIKGSSTRALILENVKVPVGNLLGEVGRGHVIAFNILNIGRWKLAAGCVGGMKAVVGLSAKYANEREQFDKPISSFGLVQSKLAQMNILTYVTESLVYRTAGLMDDALSQIDFSADDFLKQAAKAIGEYALEASINKVFGSEALDYCVDEGVQIHGGYGYMQEYLIERLYRDSRINRIFEGTNEINRLLIPDTLIKKGFKGELPLMAVMGSLPNELMNIQPFVDDGSPLAQEQHLIAQAKKIFLMVAGQAVQKYQMALKDEQELLGLAADMAIQIYAAESAVLRALKSGSVAQAEMASVFTHQAFDKIEAWAKEGLAALEDGDTLRTQLSVLRRLARREHVNTVAMKRAIAARVIEAEAYQA